MTEPLPMSDGDRQKCVECGAWFTEPRVVPVENCPDHEHGAPMADYFCPVCGDHFAHWERPAEPLGVVTRYECPLCDWSVDHELGTPDSSLDEQLREHLERHRLACQHHGSMQVCGNAYASEPCNALCHAPTQEGDQA